MREMRGAFAETASDLVAADGRVAVVLAEITTEPFAAALHEYPDRVVNIGIMEQAMVGVAAGFAMEGFHPIAHSLSPFIAERPYEQLKLDFGYQGLGGTFVGVGGSYDYGMEGATHHAPADATLMLAIPGMEVLIPGHGEEMARLLRATYANGRPTYVRASVASNAEARAVAPGQIEVVRRGADAIVLAFGPMLDRALEACEGLDVTVAYATSLEPFDHVGLRSIAGPAPRMIAIEPFYEGTSAAVLARTFAGHPTSLAFVGVPRAFIHGYGTPEELDADLGLDAAGLRERISTFLI
ncbi:MAG: transketolase C-terminal domain-containing protein [Actinomycetota bacterium]